MKRTLKTSKRGFTLLEIMVVVAIIVILAGAVVIGIFADLNNYKSYLNSLDADGWEGGARQVVKDIIKGGSYTPQVATTQTTDESESSESSDPTVMSGESSDDTVNSSESSQITTPTNPAPTNGASGTVTLGSGDSALTGRITSGSGSASASSNADDWGSTEHRSSKISVSGGQIYSAVISVQGNNAVVENVDWRYSVTPLGNNKYEIKYTADNKYNAPISSMNFDYKGDKGTTSSNITVESVQLFNK